MFLPIRKETKENKEREYEASLLTEDAVRTAAENGNKNILIGTNCLITPLAMDCIRENEIHIRRAGDVCGCG